MTVLEQLELEARWKTAELHLRRIAAEMAQIAGTGDVYRELIDPAFEAALQVAKQTDLPFGLPSPPI